MDWSRLAQDRNAWNQVIQQTYPTLVPDSHRTLALNRWTLAAGRPQIPTTMFTHTNRKRNRHMKPDPATGLFQCPACPQQFPRVTILRAHYNAEHRVIDSNKIAVATYSCPDCAQTWRTSYQRKQHICPVRPRPGPKVHPRTACQHCSQLISAPNLARHEAGCRGSEVGNRTCERCQQVLGSVLARNHHEGM